MLPLRKIIAIILFANFYVLSVGSQNLGKSFILDNYDNIRIKNFNVEEGLSDRRVFSMIKDSDNFIWIGTEYGLNRFDGNSFKNFYYNEMDPNSICGNVITKLLEDKSGNIWIGTFGGGLCYLDSDRKAFYKVHLNNISSDMTEYISDMVLDEDGTIWVSSTFGLFKLNFYSDGSLHQENFLMGKGLKSLYLNNSETLLIGAFGGQIYEFDIHGKGQPKELTNNPFGNSNSFLKHGSELFLGTSNGLFVKNIRTNELKRFFFDEQKDIKIAIRSFVEAKDDLIWIATSNGLYIFDINKKKTVLKLDEERSKEIDLSDNNINCLYKFSQDQLFIGTDNGLDLLDFSSKCFTNISKDMLGHFMLNDNMVSSVFKDGKDIWVGTSKGGLNLIRSGKSYFFPIKLWDKRGYTNIEVTGIVKDYNNNRLWFATNGGLGMINLDSFNPNQPKFRVFYTSHEDVNSISGNNLLDIAIDHFGTVWGASYGNGLFSLSLSHNNDLNVIRYNNFLDNSKGYGGVICIAVDHSNNIWAGTLAGLVKLSFKDNDKKNLNIEYYKKGNDKNGLSHNLIYDILVGTDNRIWLATFNGLNLYKGDGKFESWTSVRGFPGVIAYSIEEDDFGNLWLGTKKGLVKFNKEDQSFTKYTVNDGIKGNDFFPKASFKDSTGTIYMGGEGGITYFQPDNIREINEPKPLYFSKLRVKDSIIEPTISKNSILKKSLFNTSNLTFNYDEFPFFIGISSIDYRLNKNVQYVYKLLPTDTEWQKLSKPEIQFAHLAPGDYTLQVSAMTHNEIWDQAPLEMQIEIIPPWYMSWWAYSIYSLMVLAIVLAFYRFDIKRQLAIKEMEKSQALDALKSKMFTNISHELRTPLTIVRGLSSLLVKESASQKNQELVKGIQDSNDQLLSLVNQMLDLAALDANKMEVHYKNGDVIKFIEKSANLYRSYSDSKSQTISFESDIHELFMDFDNEKIQKIINNLLSNAIKFTPKGGSIAVNVEAENNELVIKVSDTGTGIDETDLDQVFERHFKKYDIQGKEGSGIGLALTKDLVELLGGNVSVKSIKGKGSVFTVKLPIKNEAINTDIDYQIPFVKGQMNATQILPMTNSDTVKPSILIVEDNQDIQNFISLLLSENYRIIAAKNGRKGLKIASKKEIDFIVSDVMMPKMDGFEFCKKIKADIKTSHIPFVILSARTASKDKQEAYRLGIDAYLTKPFNGEELKLIIANLLEKKQERKHYFKDLLHLREDYKNTLDINEMDLNLIKNLQMLVLNCKEKCSIDQLAKKLYISRAHLHRKLIALTGMSTTQYINYVRLEKAKHLLSTTNLMVKEIAYTVGFDSSTYFSKLFKKEVGETPEVYRNTSK